MGKFVTESEMKFGPYNEESFIYIEKHPRYERIQQDMKMSELIYYNEDKKQLISLEAKKSAPNPHSTERENPMERFREFIDEICEKFQNSLDLYTRLALEKDTPKGFFKIDYKETEIVFILVIKNHKKEWLGEVKDAIEMSVRRIHRLNKIWKCRVLVLNEEMALRNNLMVES